MTRTVNMDAGRFNRQLSIENIVNLPDGFGGFEKQYVIDGSVWAHLCPHRTSVKVLGRTRIQETSHRIFMRFRAGITPGTRLVTGSRRFEVLTVHDPDETGRYLECEVTEQ